MQQDGLKGSNHAMGRFNQ